MMNPSLRYFTAVARHGSIREAADDLHIAQSALSRQIHKLEEELGVPLLQRHPRGITLTSAGEIFLRYARSSLSQVEKVRSELDALKGLRRGTIVIHAIESLVPHLLLRAGQPILRVARQDGRDAVFDAPAFALRSVTHDPVITVRLADDPKVIAKGRVREVAAQADPITRTFGVRVGLSDPPATMRLGATVVGQMHTAEAEIIRIPATALIDVGGQPAVWLVDSQSQTVSQRPIEVANYGTSTVEVAQGLSDGEVVVTAGVHALRPGQKVRVPALAP